MGKIFVKKGDTVKVLSGKDKKKVGEVLVVYPKTRTAIVRGVNIVVKHEKKKQGEEKGHIVKREARIRLSKVMVIEKENNIPTRIGRKKDKDGNLQRYSKKTGNFI
jgi:large subunit ribosomal protein L24